MKSKLWFCNATFHSERLLEDGTKEITTTRITRIIEAASKKDALSIMNDEYPCIKPNNPKYNVCRLGK